MSGCEGSKHDPPSVQLAPLERKIDEVLTRLPTHPVVREPDFSTLSRESKSDLAWILISNDPVEKTKLVVRRIEQSRQYKKAGLENVQAIVSDLEGLNVVLNAPEHLELDLLQKVEQERNRLVTILRNDIPAVVRDLDEQALKASEFRTAKRDWTQSSGVLGFYPSSNDPTESGKIQDLISAHDDVLGRIELVQQQRYNLWACRQVRKAWKDFEENTDPGARSQACLHFLGPIHPGLLDPVSLELYRDFLQTVRSKLSREVFGMLSERLATAQRKMLTGLTKEDVQ
jgi:hypothetical protein